jgi:hypothetical protein
MDFFLKELLNHPVQTGRMIVDVDLQNKIIFLQFDCAPFVEKHYN